MPHYICVKLKCILKEEVLSLFMLINGGDNGGGDDLQFYIV